MQRQKVDFVSEKLFELSPYELAYFMDLIQTEFSIGGYQGGIMYNPKLDKYLKNGKLKRRIYLRRKKDNISLIRKPRDCCYA